MNRLARSVSRRLVEIPSRDAKARRRDVDADAHFAARQAAHREGIVDLRGAKLIQAESSARRERQVLGCQGQRVRGEGGTAGKKLVQEALQVIVMRIAKQTAALEEPRAC